MMLLRRYIKAKNDARTNLFHRYLEVLFQAQLKKRMKTPWMREGDLDESLPDEPFRGETPRSLLSDHHAVPEGAPNIFILQGDMGDGRKFYLKKMIEVCYEEINHIVWEQAQKQDVKFRFPILAVQEVVDQAESETGPLSLIEFALGCMVWQLKLDVEEQGTAQALLKKLGQMGKLAVFFNEGMCKDTNALINRLILSEGQAYQPIAVFIESSEFPLMGNGKYYCLRLKPLKVQQIVRYLCAELPEHYCPREAEKMLREQAEVADILSKPERLLIHIRGIEENTTDITITKIYESFLLKQVDQAYDFQRDRAGTSASKEQMTEWLVCRAKGKEFPDVDVGRQCQQCFADSEIFNRDLTDFRFEGCKYFLIAQSYFSHGNSWNSIRKRIRHILLYEHPMVLKFFAGLCVEKINHPETFFRQTVALIRDTKEKDDIKKVCNAPAKLLADILTFTSRVSKDGVEFVKWAGKEMWKDVYDTSVLEALANLNKQNNAILSMLEERYTETENAREKRRIVYCFSCMGPGTLSEQMILNFCDIFSTQTDAGSRHLQYHISTALIDCCKQSDDLYSHFERLKNALGEHPDPILRSDFDTLYTQIYNIHYQLSREEQQKCENELIHLLEHGTYFQKAHAAGALGRRNYGSDEGGIRSVIDRLLTALDRNLSDMSAVQTLDPDTLKAVSYIVESCCRLAERNSGCCNEVRDGLKQQLESHIEALVEVDVPISVYQCLEIALKLVVAGLIWLLDPKTGVRTELGKCFSSETTILDAVSKLTQSDEATYEEGLSGKIRILEELSDPARMEKMLRGKFQYRPQFGQELDFSLADLRYENKRVMSGFFFYYQDNIYFITCRHCFFDGGTAEKPRIPLENNDQLTFSLTYLDNAEQYHGRLRYPTAITEPASFDGNAADDLVIYQLTDVPAGFMKVVFSKQHTLDTIGMEDRLRALSFPEGSQILGRSIYGYRYSTVGHGFFSLEADQRQPLGDSANWFSGVPIIKEDNGIRIAGMWKGSNGEDQHILGITMSTILSGLDEISNERMTDS